jgi:two-component system NtrC family response regulator
VSERKRVLIVDATESERRRLEARLSDEYEVRAVSPRPEGEAPPGLAGMVGACDSMREVFGLLRRAAVSDAGVLITGECGTGKELAARVIHGLSARRAASFVTLNADAFDAARLGVELFGRPNGSSGPLRGALEHADGGTLLIGGIDNVPHALQEKLLSYVRTGTFRRIGEDAFVETDVRLLVASDEGLDRCVESGTVRRDLFYALGVVTVALPPLRERGSDVTLLAQHFVRICAPECGASVSGFSRDALSAIVSHDWPGNIAELENRIRRALIVASGERILPSDLGLERGERTHRTLREARDQLTMDMVVAALRRAVGNVSAAARSIGVSRPTMYDLIRKYDLDVADFKNPTRLRGGRPGARGAQARQ